MRPNGAKNQGNEYQVLIDQTIYKRTPKTVLAAMVVSFLLHSENANIEDVNIAFVREWRILNENGIVPQKPISVKKYKQQKYVRNQIEKRKA